MWHSTLLYVTQVYKAHNMSHNMSHTSTHHYHFLALFCVPARARACVHAHTHSPSPPRSLVPSPSPSLSSPPSASLSHSTSHPLFVCLPPSESSIMQSLIDGLPAQVAENLGRDPNHKTGPYYWYDMAHVMCSDVRRDMMST